ncbi:MAG: hypothetical protein FWC65_05350, partial [Treponema sp.]|nr:hypothetical protein [Treponema sp.]
MRGRFFPVLKSLTAKTILRDKTLWRILLILALAFYLPQTGVQIPSPAGRAAAQTAAITQAEDGMGGGIFLENAIYQTDLNLVYIPEQVEYSRPRMLTFSFY